MRTERLVHLRKRYGVPASAGRASTSSNASDNADISPAKAGTPSAELVRPRTAQRLYLPKADFAAQGCDLSLNRYKELHTELARYSSGEILASLADLEKEIVLGVQELESMLAKPADTK